MFILFLVYDSESKKLKLNDAKLQMLQNTLSMIQTIVAAVVVLSYYTEYRANLKFTI
jgi:type III secretory pathway lipoprotein EscJ